MDRMYIGELNSQLVIWKRVGVPIVNDIMTSQDVIDKLNLEPLPKEGGYYRETYRSAESFPCRLRKIDSPRSYSTCIYYLITPSSFSPLHKVQEDEIFHFYCGDPVEMFLLYDDQRSKSITIGSRIFDGEVPQVVAPANVWQGTRLIGEKEDAWALLGCTVAPGFDFHDFEMGKREELIAQFPQYKEQIERYTVAE